MKSACAVIVIGSFFAIAVFGIFVMSHGPGHSHTGCIAATAGGADCPKGEGALSFIAFHLNALRSFSTATFGDNFANTLFMFAALALSIILGTVVRSGPGPRTPATNYHRRRSLGSHSFAYQREFTGWLALHENSPSFT